MIKTFIFCWIVTLVIAVPLALLSMPWWNDYIDQTPPSIELKTTDSRIGVGSAGGKIQFTVKDETPGLDEVVVRLRQLRADRELSRHKLHGVKEATLEAEIPATRNAVGEGAGEIEVVAFDRSYYSNRASTTAKAFIDTRTPYLEVLTTQHNLRQGGCQLVLYVARDDNLADSGVRVGKLFFKGYPATQLDNTLSRPGLYAALYTVPIGNNIKPDELRVQAVDIGGNLVEQSFYNKIARRVPRLLNPSNAKLLTWLTAFASGEHSTEQIETTEDDNDKKGTTTAAIDAATLVQAFDRVPGTAVLTFSDRLNVAPNSGIATGDEFIFTGVSEARALHPGEISQIQEHAGVFDITVDHGLGLSSVYKGLASAAVTEGLAVKSGDSLGAVNAYLAVGTRINGQAVDPTEWWSQDWISAHLSAKIQDVKKNLGIVVE